MYKLKGLRIHENMIELNYQNQTFPTRAVVLCAHSGFLHPICPLLFFLIEILKVHYKLDLPISTRIPVANEGLVRFFLATKNVIRHPGGDESFLAYWGTRGRGSIDPNYPNFSVSNAIR